jgi:peptidyl-prolyl cis-trans isomerase D
MMQGFRKAGQTWLGRLVITVLFGTLILSFAIWGIGDMIRNAGGRNVAAIGGTKIDMQAYRDAYMAEMQNLSRRIRRNLTADEARAIGLEQRVLQKMLSDAAMDERVQRFGLAISNETIAKAILADRNFQGSDGKFSRAVFDEVLRQNGFNEQSFVQAQRSVYLRGQIGEAIAGGVTVPALMTEALHRYRNERRDVSFLTLGPAAVGEIPAASEDQLKAFFEEHKAEFRAPEYRKADILALTPAGLADPASVSDADALAAYEKVKTTRFTTAEKRTIRQLLFPDTASAEAAAIKIRGGESFDTVAQERGLKPEDTDLGSVTRSGIADPAIADAAFGAEMGTLIGPVNGRFGSVVVLVTAIEPQKTVPFDTAAPILKAELARQTAAEKIRSLHDAIEDQRASAKPIEDVAKDLGLTLTSIEAIDRNGLDRKSEAVALPERQVVLPALFGTDIGVDNEAIAMRDGGWVWYAVTRIEPARDRDLTEVREQVASAWKTDETVKRVASLASEAVRKLSAGTPIEDVAKTYSVAIATANGVQRSSGEQGQPASPLPPAALSQAFLTRVGQSASALGAAADQRVIVQVTRAEVTPITETDRGALQNELEYALGDDMLTVFITETKRELGVTIYDGVIRTALGNAGP